MMNRFFYVFAILVSVSVIALASPAQQCDGFNIEGLQDRIQVDPCGETKCDLRKEQNTTMVVKFLTKDHVKTLTNNVHALIGGLLLPFLGVHGTSACTNIVHAEDKTRASCPLQPNKEYIYTNVFYVEPIYPEVPLKVIWSLDDGDDKVTCFEIPASIIKKKKH